MIAINQYISLPQITREVADIEHTVAICDEMVQELDDTCNFQISEEYPEILERMLHVKETIYKLQKERSLLNLCFGVRKTSDELFETYDWLSEIYAEVLDSKEVEEEQKAQEDYERSKEEWYACMAAEEYWEEEACNEAESAVGDRAMEW